MEALKDFGKPVMYTGIPWKVLQTSGLLCAVDKTVIRQKEEKTGKDMIIPVDYVMK